jgi:hypothetical protein
MATSVQNIYDQVCSVLLEPSGFTLGITTQQTFLDLFRAVLLDWYQQTGLIKQVCTQTLTSGTATYTVPDDIISPEEAWWGSKYLQKTSMRELDQYEFAWTNRSGPPDRWFDDSLPPKQLTLYKKPNQTGASYAAKYGTFYPADRNLAVLGTAGTLKTSFALGDTIPNVPDSFSCYLAYGVLEKLFSTDGECKDLQRSYYCQARYLEGVAIARAWAGQAA